MLQPLTCPKCTNPMNHEQRPGGDFYRCAHCSGLWFNMGEHNRLVDAAESVDPGDAPQDLQYNTIDRIDCPKCKVPLIRMVDAKQPHIWYESCQACFGRFYDAGEFRDFAEYTISDYLKQFSVTPRD